MNCPKCNSPGAEECAEEVDIGVGTQRFVYGYECVICGQLVVCRTCGGVDTDHSTWCADVKGN